MLRMRLPFGGGNRLPLHRLLFLGGVAATAATPASAPSAP
jgi:hypothetical protein